MGKPIWHEQRSPRLYHGDCLHRLDFGLVYRKFFGTLFVVAGPILEVYMNQDAFFIIITIKAPAIQIIYLNLGLLILALEYPAPCMQCTAAYQSLVARVVLLVFLVFFAIWFYQGSNGAIWSLVTIFVYTRAMRLGEVMSEAKDNKPGGSILKICPLGVIPA